eukprot:scaffold123980_cov69-Phaeocystis_antarctica.AAC.3
MEGHRVRHQQVDRMVMRLRATEDDSDGPSLRVHVHIHLTTCARKSATLPRRPAASRRGAAKHPAPQPSSQSLERRDQLGAMLENSHAAAKRARATSGHVASVAPPRPRRAAARAGCRLPDPRGRSTAVPARDGVARPRVVVRRVQPEGVMQLQQDLPLLAQLAIDAVALRPPGHTDRHAHALVRRHDSVRHLIEVHRREDQRLGPERVRPHRHAHRRALGRVPRDPWVPRPEHADEHHTPLHRGGECGRCVRARLVAKLPRVDVHHIAASAVRKDLCGGEGGGLAANGAPGGRIDDLDPHQQARGAGE